jgi:4-hydroxy-2-oxoheptanedioate aldolase
MKYHTTLRDLLERDEPALGTMVQISSEVIVDMIGMAGFDWITLDMEHTTMGVEHVAALTRAAEAAGMATVVRPSSTDQLLIGRVLDCGVDALIIPRVSTADEARAAVAATRFPPRGIRGVCPETRAGAYHLMALPDYIRRAEMISVGLLIETKAAMENLEEILAVDGIQFAMLGPADLAFDLGIPPGSKEIYEAQDELDRVGGEHGVEIIGLIGRGTTNEDLVLAAKQQARKLYWCSADTVVVAQAFAAIERDVRQRLASSRG